MWMQFLRDSAVRFVRRLLELWQVEQLTFVRYLRTFLGKAARPRDGPLATFRLFLISDVDR